MSTKILVATPDPAFGEWLQASLVENGDYDVHRVQTGSEVLLQAAADPFAVAILDSDLPGEPFVPLARSLLTLLPGVRLLVIPPENNPHHPNLAGLVPHGYLYKPFYLLGLLDALQSLLAPNDRPSGIEPAPVEVASPMQSWLEDPAQAGRELSRLLLETSAQTALIAAAGRLWASAGQISQAAAQEAAALLENCWQQGRPVDLARYLRLEAGGSEHLLYAVPLLDELALALLFEPATPFTRARREAARLARALTAAAAARPLPERPQTPPASPAPEPEPPLADFTAPPGLNDWLPETETGDAGEFPAPITGAQDEPAPPISPLTIEWTGADLRAALSEPDELLSETETGGERVDEFFPEEEPLIDLSSVLAGMPSPDPGGEPVFPAPNAWEPEQAAPQPEPEGDQAVEARLDALSGPLAAVEPPPASPVEQPVEPPAAPPLVETRPVLDTEPEIPAWLAGIDFPPPPAPAGTHPVPTPSDAGKTGPVSVRAPREQPPEPVEDAPLPATRPQPVQRALPVTAGISYTCILIPERPDHYLTGGLADSLDMWVPQLCLAFGWHLSDMAVRPGYLQWTVELDPSVSPGNVVRILRQRTSERIFSQYPEMRYGLAREDFWAPGYLAVRGTRPPSVQLLDDFVRQTRARQRY